LSRCDLSRATACSVRRARGQNSPENLSPGHAKRAVRRLYVRRWSPASSSWDPMASAWRCLPSQQLWPGVGPYWLQVVGCGSAAVAAKCSLTCCRKSQLHLLYRPRGVARRPAAPPPLFPTSPVPALSAARLRKRSSYLGTWDNLVQIPVSADYALVGHLSRRRKAADFACARDVYRSFGTRAAFPLYPVTSVPCYRMPPLRGWNLLPRSAHWS